MVPRPAPGGGPAFFERKPEERTPGRREVLSALDPPLSGWWPERGFLFLQNWPAALYPTPVTARPPAGRAGKRGFADGKGRPCTQPFLVEAEKGGSRLSPQRNFSPAPLGNPVAPSSVTFGDSFPPRGSLWVVQPYTKKRSKSGHVHGFRNSPSTGTMRPTTPKRASGNERAIKKGVQGARPPALFLPISREKWGPRRAGGPPGRCAPRLRKSPDHGKGTQHPTAPPPWRRCTPGWVPRSRCPGPG